MGRIVMTAQSEPSTPSSGVVTMFPDSTSELMTYKDDGGRVYPMYGFLGMFSSSDFTGTDVNTAQPIFDTGLDAITVVASTTYIIDACFHIHTTGTTSHQLGLLFGGTATLTSIGYGVSTTNIGTETFGSNLQRWVDVATVTNISSAVAAATHHTCMLHGILRVNAAGTFIPQYQWSAAPGVAGVTLANSYFMLHPIGPNTRTVVGPVA